MKFGDLLCEHKLKLMLVSLKCTNAYKVAPCGKPNGRISTYKINGAQKVVNICGNIGMGIVANPSTK